MRSAWRRATELVKTLAGLARDPRIPRPVRWLLVFAALPIPGPVDELVGLLALGLVALFWRPVYREIRERQRAGEPKAATTEE